MILNHRPKPGPWITKTSCYTRQLTERFSATVAPNREGTFTWDVGDMARIHKTDTAPTALEAKKAATRAWHAGGFDG